MGDQNAPERRIWAEENADPILRSHGVLSACWAYDGQQKPEGSTEYAPAAELDRVVVERDQAVRDGLEVARGLNAERDEARTSATYWENTCKAALSGLGRTQERLRKAEARADRYREGLDQANDLLGADRYAAARSVITAALAEGEQPEYGPAATGVGESCELGGDVHGEWCNPEGEQPAGECAGCRGTGIRIGALESPTETCDCAAGVREEARNAASAAGVQSTTETATGDEPPECGEPHPEDDRLVCRKRIERDGLGHGGGHLFAPPDMTDEQLLEGWHQVVTGAAPVVDDADKCPNCDGSGDTYGRMPRFSDHRCKTCGGTGSLPAPATPEGHDHGNA